MVMLFSANIAEPWSARLLLKIVLLESSIDPLAINAPPRPSLDVTELDRNSVLSMIVTWALV